MDWLKDYPEAEIVLYDRSDNNEPAFTFQPGQGVTIIKVPNVGSDIYDKFTYIIDNYDNLPEIAIYSKANLFKYISKEEFDEVKDNKTFTPILTQKHKTEMPIAYYSNGLYNEINNYWYLNSHPAKYAKEIKNIFKMDEREYNAFAPGSSYILPKSNILQYPKEFYQLLRSFLDWTVYPGDAQMLERNLYYLWNGTYL